MQRPIIYQVFTRLFGNDNQKLSSNGTKAENGCGKFADFTLKALEEIRGLGATHIWYTGVIEHATQTNYGSYGISTDHPAVVKGKAGSPYAIKDYYDVDPDLATKVDSRMQEFHNLVNRTHKAGLKVIIDFVPNHVARQYHSDACPQGTKDLGSDDNASLAFSVDNNFYYLPGESFNADFDIEGYDEYPARATGNDVFSAYVSRNDWYETVKLNYGVDVCNGRVGHFDPVPNTWGKMLNILLFWAEKGIDGFRCDMAEMVPVEFWHWVIPQVKVWYPDIVFVAEVYNPNEYRNYIHHGGFDYLYDKVGLYDTLKDITCGRRSAQDITTCWQSVDDIRCHMLNFLENHDEQRLASDYYAGNPLQGRAPLLVSAMMGKNPMMIYFGQELGERGMDEEGFSGRDGRTTIFDYWSVDTIRRWRNKGKFDNKLLTDDEIQLQAFYRVALSLCNVNEALCCGDFYDLMYVNSHLHRQYVFLRHSNKKCVLVVANFSANDESLIINVPQNVFDLYGLPQKDLCLARDLLTDNFYNCSFNSRKPVEISVPGYSGVVLELDL